AEGLRYVYVGNLPGHPGENTYCPKCRRAGVERAGFTIRSLRIRAGKCEHCQEKIAGVWGA
ncbi:MAG: radical SAM protein, partial [Acidobacteriota bacterium]